MASKRYGESTECFPDVYTKVPAPVKNKKPGQLTQQRIEQFYKDGFLVVKDFFDVEELEPCKTAIEGFVEELAQKLYNGGKIDRLYEEFGVFQRLTELEKAWPGANVLLFKQGKLPEEFMTLWSNEKLLNMVEQIVGPDIIGHPVWNLRVKTPKNDATVVPWHQDAAYFCEKSYDHMIVTAWIPFLDTNAENGGMQMMRGSHRMGKVVRHTCCHDDTWFVTLEEEEMRKNLGVKPEEDTVMCDVPFGGFLLFNNMTAHRSVTNTSNDVRWSVDLRWQSPKYNPGFYDITDGVIMHTEKDGVVTPDWASFLKVNRKEVWQTKYFKEIFKTDEFDTIVTGPWIGRWEIVHKNRHTDAFEQQRK
ncbi:hypothetical protein CAPTEDRAFT_219502 [Capitella teleta]|uniref:Uncharacterized protein n=1 Tax=Capitella teleta TaxID=283909 RepID=X2APN4_CAPTE|nr:hypothetical protein CAPTEDRAFT_219502 [Capitella teleta]|eukprot:ELU10156.1 hypothetical protein CAPTEDRAFT_219502 [Capitella teleta]